MAQENHPWKVRTRMAGRRDERTAGQGGGAGGREDLRVSATAGVMMLVCLECGKEYAFEGADEPPADLTCEKCGNVVFRRFDATATPDDVQADFAETTDRETATSDPPGDVTAGDLYDLNNP
jgi:DNA-directed RNA polymerase subunit RPC12/RpoP